MSSNDVPGGGLDFLQFAGPPMPSQAPQEDPDPIGGYVSSAANPAGDPLRVGDGFDPYYEGDEFTTLDSLNLEDLTRLQQQLRAVGYADKDIEYGKIDDKTLKAFYNVMSLANRHAEDWKVTLGRLATEGTPDEEQLDEFQPQPYLAPDYATLAQRVKSTFREQLGRDPDDYELQQLSSELSGFDALAHEREQELKGMAADDSLSGGEVQGVDPLARFNERFEELYSGEQSFIEDKRHAADARTSVQKTTSMIDSAAREVK